MLKLYNSEISIKGVRKKKNFLRVLERCTVRKKNVY